MTGFWGSRSARRDPGPLDGATFLRSCFVVKCTCENMFAENRMSTQTETKTTTAPVYCVNHPNTETLLRCYRCGNPVCIKCVQRTPVGLICKQCLSNQQAGFFTATPLDYALVLAIGSVVSFVAGAIAGVLGFLWFIAIFYGPAAGGVIAEIIRFAIRKRRGRYIGLLAAALVVVGAIVAIEGRPILATLVTGQFSILGRGLFNIGLWIYLVLAPSTVYARLR